jgi:hypothetical protein
VAWAKAAYTACDGLEHRAAVRLNRRVHEGVVAGHRRSVGGKVGRQRVGGALDVGEQERHRAAGKRRRPRLY